MFFSALFEISILGFLFILINFSCKINNESQWKDLIIDNSMEGWHIFQDDGTIVISLPPDVDDGLNLVDGIEMSVAATSNNSEAASACVS